MTATRALTMLNEQGDLTIVWSEEDDDRMEAIIQQKMDAGVAFFIIEPRFGGIAAPNRRPLEDPAEARRHRALSIRDADIARFVGEEAATATVTKTPVAPVKTVRRAKTAKEAAGKETVGTRPMRGG